MNLHVPFLAKGKHLLRSINGSHVTFMKIKLKLTSNMEVKRSSLTNSKELFIFCNEVEKQMRQN